MLNITITEQTPANMLRAIRAACNELLGETHADLTTQAAQHNSRANELHAAASAETNKAAACLTAHNAGTPAHVTEQDGREYLMVHAEQPSEQTTAIQIIEPIEDNRQDRVHVQSDVDSSGTEWNPELHASTKAKNQDGTWKKRRGTARPETTEEATEQIAAAFAESPIAAPSLPPIPPAPPAAPLVTMNDIYALITNNKCVLNDVIAGAQAMGFADVGAFSRDATPEQRAQLLAQLTKEVA